MPNQQPDASRTSYGADGQSNTGPAAPDRSDAPSEEVNPQGVDLARKAGFPRDHQDARLVKIADANFGEYSADGMDDSNPAKLEKLAGGAFLSSEKLLGEF